MHWCRSWVWLKIILYCMAHTHTEQTGRTGTIGRSSLCFSSAFYCLPGTTDCESLNTGLSHTKETGMLSCYCHWMKPGQKIAAHKQADYTLLCQRGKLGKIYSMQVPYSTSQFISCTVIVWEFSVMGILLLVIAGMKDIKQTNHWNEFRNTGGFIMSESHTACLNSPSNNKGLPVNIAGETLNQRSNRDVSVCYIYCFNFLFKYFVWFVVICHSPSWLVAK